MPTLVFNMQTQNQTYWCWAAVAVSTHLFYGGTQWTMQCQLVDDEFTRVGIIPAAICCQPGSSAACNQLWYLNRALQTTGNLSTYSNYAEPWGAVVQEINGHRPLGVRIRLAGNVGHFLIINGYTLTQAGNQTVAVQDPWFGNSTMNYATLVQGYQGGSWTDSFFTT